MSSPSRGAGRSDRRGQPQGRFGGAGRGGSAGRGDQGKSGGSAQGSSNARARRQGKPSGAGGKDVGRTRPDHRDRTESGPGAGDSTARVDGEHAGQRGGSARRGSVGRGSWDRNRSQGGESGAAGAPRGADRAATERSRGAAPRRPERAGTGRPDRAGRSSDGSYSSRGRAEPRRSGAPARGQERGPVRLGSRPDARDKQAQARKREADAGPAIPEWARPDLLEDAVRDELSSLAAGNAAKVAGHLVATGELLEEDPQLALAHARAARASASRLACVREAVGVAAYHAGEYAEASRELRTYRRLSGRAEYLAVLADCERAAGRPEAALRLLAEAPRTHPGHAEWVEQRIVQAGARRDLGEIAGAILVLRDALTAIRKGAGIDDDDLIRLRYAFADGLEAAGRREEAIAEFTAIAESDDSERTDAGQRAGLPSDLAGDQGDTYDLDTKTETDAAETDEAGPDQGDR